MKRFSSLILFVGFSLLFALQVQAEKTDTVVVKKSGIVVGLKYLSNNVYLGRIDSANIMYLVPTIGYYHKSGLHVAASLNYQLDAGLNKIDAVVLEGGYDFKIGDNFSGGLSAEKYFYNINSIALNSVIDLGVTSNFSYDFSLVTLNIGGGLAFNDKTDIISEAGLNKTFELGKFAIEPTFKFNAGTQNYYNTYLEKGKSHLSGNNGRGKSLGNIKSAVKGKSVDNVTTYAVNTSTSAATAAEAVSYTVVEASMYKILDYEMSVPFSYTYLKYKFELDPSYSIPVNPATILSSTGTVQKENISNHFVLQMEVTYKFN